MAGWYVSIQLCRSVRNPQLNLPPLNPSQFRETVGSGNGLDAAILTSSVASYDSSGAKQIEADAGGEALP